MHLASVETIEEQKCLDDIFMSTHKNKNNRNSSLSKHFMPAIGYNGVSSQSYWTGGINKYQEEHFVWATPNREYPVSSQMRFTQNASGLTGGDLNCLLYNARMSYSSALSVDKCKQKRPYMCEASEN